MGREGVGGGEWRGDSARFYQKKGGTNWEVVFCLSTEGGWVGCKKC